MFRPAGSAGPPDHLHAGRPSAHVGVTVSRVITPSLVCLSLKAEMETGKKMDLFVYVQADGRSGKRGLRAGGKSYEMFQGVPKDEGCPR
ncbi:hypothetical protein VE00_01696 [Pseudogymnoascus sp. WSF 3629]|nr:hypothetical protein VE00_01696 [Pseudogymnoascus sp. WSF 3629]